MSAHPPARGLQEDEESGTLMSTLTDEILMYMLKFVEDAPLLIRSGRVSRRWKEVSSHEDVWRSITQRESQGRQPPMAGGKHEPLPFETWRQAYIRILYDTTRLEISTAELCGSNWTLHFHNDMFLFHSSPTAAAARSQGAGEAKFNATGNFTSTVDGAPSMRTALQWQLYTKNEDGMLEDVQGSYGHGTHVQVGAYPILTLTRTPDWGWSLSNKFVYMLSNNNIPLTPRHDLPSCSA